MTDKPPELRVVFNATSLRPGGGLTVLLGVLQGLASQTNVIVRATVICCASQTADAIREQGVAEEVIVRVENQSLLRRQLFVRFGLGRLAKKLNADVFFSVNQFVENVSCPQVVYHLNLLRFMPVDKTKGLIHQATEWLRNRSSKLAVKKAEANVFESSYLQSCAIKMHGDPVALNEVIYIGLPDDLIESTTVSKTLPDPSSTVISITNHNPHKDNPTLIRFLHSLVTRYPDVDWKLKIAGSLFPERWKPFKDLAIELGVESRIEWLGFVSQDDLTHHLSSSLCLVSTSRVESFCMVALEAMARGCPAICTDASAMPESVENAGVMVNSGDHDAFADAVATIYEQPEVREDFVKLGYERIQTFRWDRCGNEFANLLLRLTSDESSKAALPSN